MEQARPRQISKGTIATVVIAAGIVVAVVLLKSNAAPATNTPSAPAPAAPATNAAAAIVELSSSQLSAIKVEALDSALFPVDKEAVGNINFDDDLSVQVFPPYQGKILKAMVELGDDVQKGQPLYTIQSPDLVQAESSLIGSAATLELTDKELTRAKELYSTNVGISERELEQATQDQKTAEGALRAARDAVGIFGKTDAEIDQIIAQRKIDPALIVRSPIAGKITAMNAPPGSLVQPGNSPAPYSVADVSSKWMLANVIESDSPLYRDGEPVRVSVMAYPGRVFEGRISKVYPVVDSTTHRLTVRCEITDAKNELRPGMFANFTIQVREPVRGTALPVNGLVRNGDGTMAAWATTDRRHFTQRLVKIGLEYNGCYQVLEGLQPGELAVTDGAIFISNMLQAPPSD